VVNRRATKLTVQLSENPELTQNHCLKKGRF
jgi:hypothetical protein